MTDKDWSDFFEEMDKKLGIQSRDETEAEKEFRLLCEGYMKATDEYKSPMGYPDIDPDELVQFAKAAILSGKPINWTEIFGLMPWELYPGKVLA